MHRNRRMHRRHGCRGRSESREDQLKRLEEYQRDLEQEIADVADEIGRLRQEKPAETSTV
jgi:hypothetical protein